MATITAAPWRTPRASRVSPALAGIRAIARRTADRLRPAALTILGLASIDTGVFTANTVAGWIVTGISLLVLEYRIDGEA